jgi:CheY-like chemotaxis protein
MMPGMDGFQAVQSIKNNPRTSAIPILMYTSQEGDLYAGQARALGAEGVLPKQIKQADVTKLLFQLRLVSDRRNTVEQTTFTRVAPAPELAPANESAIVLPAPAAESAPQSPPVADLLPELSLEIRAALDQTLQKEVAALRNFIGTTLESHAERMQADLAALAPAPPAPVLDMPTLIPERRSWSTILGWTFALLATGGVAAMSWLWWNQGAEIAALRTDLSAAYAEVEALRARPEVVSVPAAPAEDPAALGTPAEASTGESIEGSMTVPTNPAIDAAVEAATAVTSTITAVEQTAPAATAPTATAPTAATPVAKPGTFGAVPAVAPESASPQTPQAQ